MKIVINMYNGITTECDLGLEHIGYVDELFLRETNKNGETYFILNEYVDPDLIMGERVVHVESMERYLDLLDDACVMIKQDLDGNSFMELDEKTEAEMKASLNRKMKILSQLYVWYKEINKMRDFKLNHIEKYLNDESVRRYRQNLNYSKEDLMELSFEDLILYRRRLEFEFSIQRDNRNSLTDFITTIIDTDDISEELYELCEINNKIIKLFESMKKLSNIMQKNKNNKYKADKMMVTYYDYENYGDDDIPF